MLKNINIKRNMLYNFLQDFKFAKRAVHIPGALYDLNT